jgi:hypothetical protein
VCFAAVSDSVSFDLSASIANHCSLTRVGTNTSPESVILANGSVSLNFTLNCNSPFKYSLSSGNGFLKYTGMNPTISGNSDIILKEAPYKTTFKATLEDGDIAEINQICESAYLKASPARCNSSNDFATSGTSVAINKSASLTISLDNYNPPLLGGQPLLAGTYQDTLTLRVALNP